jgi:hypothetical protein
MAEDIKDQLKRLSLDAERKLTKSLIRWKYEKDGRTHPTEDVLDQQADQVTARANEIIGRRAKGAWAEFKKAYRGLKPGEEETRD